MNQIFSFQRRVQRNGTNNFIWNSVLLESNHFEKVMFIMDDSHKNTIKNKSFTYKCVFYQFGMNFISLKYSKARIRDLVYHTEVLSSRSFFDERVNYLSEICSFHI